MNHSKEYWRGYAVAKANLEGATPERIAELRAEWERCEWGEDYDRGYHHALMEAERQS